MKKIKTKEYFDIINKLMNPFYILQDDGSATFNKEEDGEILVTDETIELLSKLLQKCLN